MRVLSLLALAALTATAQALPSSTCASLESRLTSSASGSNFISESDRPWTFFTLPTVPAAEALPAATEFAAQLGAPVDDTLPAPAVVDAAEFVERRLSGEENEGVKREVETAFGGKVGVYRVYKSGVEVGVYMVGWATGAEECGLVGFETTAIET
ncbi:hypothetical protein HDU96_010241 [Phlyctochytrium bullatum]|nr:hypothetical protein HDU96_010241 [Phlyctochytrium bullatum]